MQMLFVIKHVINMLKGVYKSNNIIIPYKIYFADNFTVPLHQWTSWHHANLNNIIVINSMSNVKTLLL